MKKKSKLVRYSRAGDQFHYLWAARRCLALLQPGTNLKCVTIEGVSANETLDDEEDLGEEVVDVAEYYGSDKLEDCQQVSYYQLKHSTTNANKPWTLSGLKTTLNGFFKRYQAFKSGASNEGGQQANFVFTTNRRVDSAVHSLLHRVRKRKLKNRDLKQWAQLKGYLSTQEDSQAFEFLDQFWIDDTNDNYWQQRNILVEELSGYVPGPDREGADQLWRLVTEKALPGNSSSPEITKEDVLRVLNTDEDELFPASCLIEDGEHLFTREQESNFLEQILSSDGAPVIIHADSGVGKTALARRLQKRISSHSFSVLYDCFGNGTYRSAVHVRHGHNVGFVQITNELAAHKLCHPMIPSGKAQPTDYLKAFGFRLKQAITLLRARQPDAKLVVFIDAADNAQMAAEEYNERASFPRDLIRHRVPEGVLIVYLCRTHRRDKLNPPLEYVDLALESFSEAETEQLLKRTFPDASVNDVREFHRLSLRNPRVQATWLSMSLSLAETLEMLGPNPTTAEDAIRDVFQRAIDRLLDEVPNTEASQIRNLCEALAALRPFIPMEVLSLASGMSQSAIRSFVVDLGRPISITGDAIQFFDEPSETWFRETYKPSQTKLGDFIGRIRPLTKRSSYVASALPQLMLEAGQYDELVDLVLSDSDLPSDNPVDRRNASLHRLQFALKAALRKERYEDAVKLALKAGGETAGDARQRALVQENTDLVSHLLPDHRLREIVAQKSFSTSWHGGHHAYEAALLSGCKNTVSESRSYLRLAHKWARNWSRLSPEEREEAEISDEDIAEIAFAKLNLGGPGALVEEFESWRPREVAYRAGAIVFGRLVDLGQFDLLNEIGDVSSSNLFIQLALIHAQNRVLRCPSSHVVKSAIDGLTAGRKRLKKLDRHLSYEQKLLSVVNSVAQAAVTHGSISNDEIVAVLNRYIPKPDEYYYSRFSDEPRFTLLRANCLRAALSGKTIGLLDLASPKLRNKFKENRHNYDSDSRQFREDVGSVLPWHKLWTRALLNDLSSDELDAEIEDCIKESDKAANVHYRDDRPTSNEISRLWMEIVMIVDPTTEKMERMLEWKKSLKQSLFTPALTHLASVCARCDPLSNYTFDFAKEAFDLIDAERMDAESKVDTYCKIARSVFAASIEESAYYFDQAVEVAGKIGEENLDRWSSCLELACAASDVNAPNSELAYRLSRAAEVTYDFVARDKYFDWEGTVEAITRLCSSSGPTILSRWRDRGFGWDARLFPEVLTHLIDVKKVAPDLGAAFFGFRYQWNTADFLEGAFSSHSDGRERKQIFEEIVPYLLLSGTSSSNWRKIIETGAMLACDTGHLAGYLKRAEFVDQVRRKRESAPSGNYKSEPIPSKDWDSIFAGLDTASTESIQDAYRRMRSGEPPYYLSDFAEESFRRVEAGSEGAALVAIFRTPDFRLFDLKDVFEAIPGSWFNRQHIRVTLSNILESVCREHFYEIAKSRYYQPLPFDAIAAKCGVTEREIYDWVIEASAENPSILGSGRLFSLVGLIAPKLSREEATRALDYGLRLLEEDFDKNDGDGDWRSVLYPPQETSEALAGYIWASLASPRTADRWEAAHVVCLLCCFRQDKVLDPLVDLALGQTPNPFHDKKLPHYDFSAQIWLLLALRRSIQKGYIVAPVFEEFLRSSCSLKQSHIIIRGISATCLLELYEQRKVNLSPEEILRLRGINKSGFDVIQSKSYQRNLRVLTEDLIDEYDKYYFGYDIAESWFKSLGGVFGLQSAEVELRALKVIRGDWKVQGSGGWDADPRTKRGYYRSGEDSYSKYSHPRTENLGFYRAYNSMMIVAGQLIDSIQRHQDPEYPDELSEWINEHEPTRADGLWLADRRDPQPPERQVWKESEIADSWPFSVRRLDLENAIWVQTDELCVWGDWNYSSDDRQEYIRVSSAFTRPENSMALLRALQTSSDTLGGRLPTAGSDLEVNDGLYQLKGWIQENSKELGIDEYDPWAGDICYPPLRPAEWFAQEFNLQHDYEQRVWFSEEQGGRDLLRSQMWGDQGERNDQYIPEVGQRLVATKKTMLQQLAQLKMDLILEVQIRRDFRRDSFRRERSSVVDYVPPYTLFTILEADGRLKTI